MRVESQIIMSIGREEAPFRDHDLKINQGNLNLVLLHEPHARDSSHHPPLHSAFLLRKGGEVFLEART